MFSCVPNESQSNLKLYIPITNFKIGFHANEQKTSGYLDSSKV